MSAEPVPGPDGRDEDDRPPGELTPGQLADLERTWRPPPGLGGWFRRVDHKSIALRYIASAWVFFGLAGLLAAVMRAQLALPGNTLVGPDLYNQVFTMHGTAMMFLFAVPIVEAMGLYAVPLMIGTRNVAFPRMNAYGYYVFVLAGIFLFTSFLLNIGPDAGWFNYVPLAGPGFSPGKRVDVWLMLVNFTEIAALVAAIELAVTILKMRAPGMALHRMPLYVWAMLITAGMVIFAMPSVMMASNLLSLDRLVGTHFFNPAEGGDALLWQHLFWFFGHPEVYIIFIPALGMVSAIVETFTGREVFGYPVMVLALLATGFIGFGLWVHHMFATPLPWMGQSFFTASSLLIAIPSGVQIFCWIATIWAGRPRFATPLLFVLGFIAIFVVGGLTGVMLASVSIDLQVHDTFFVVAHLHYVLIGGSVFPLLGATYYWFPKITGRLMSERLGRWNVALLFAGFNLTFFPMHVLGLQGMPRRVYTYLPETGWGPLNMLASLGAVVITASMVVFLVNVAWSWRRGARAGDNPWGGTSLEWATSSPPPAYNFAYLPTAPSRQPLLAPEEQRPRVVGLATGYPEVLVTQVLDASPDHRERQPRPTGWPLVTALATGLMFVGLMFTPWALVVGSVLVSAGLVAWVWPDATETHDEERSEAPA